MNNNKGLAPPASQDRVTDAPHEAGKPSSPFGSVPTGAWTPGPWRVHVEPPSGHIGSAQSVYICAEGEWPESQLARVNVMDGLNEQKANALLIAAAPDLYEALAACVEFHGDADWPEGDWAHLKAARAALSKATGDSK